MGMDADAGVDVRMFARQSNRGPRGSQIAADGEDLADPALAGSLDACGTRSAPSWTA
jgi:hypothetical protein